MDVILYGKRDVAYIIKAILRWREYPRLSRRVLNVATRFNYSETEGNMKTEAKSNVLALERERKEP